MLGRVLGAAVGALAIAATLVTATPAGAVTITEFPIGGAPDAHAPLYIASSPTGRLWFTDVGKEHGVRQISTGGEFIGGAVTSSEGVTAPTGDLAFDQAGALSWGADETAYPTDPRPYLLTRLANGTVQSVGPAEGIRSIYAVAYADTDYVTVQMLDNKEKPNGFGICGGIRAVKFDCFGNDVVDSRLTDLIVDGAGRLWAMQPEGDVVRRTNAAHSAFELAVPLPGGSHPGRGAIGPDGNLWVAGFGIGYDATNTTNQIVRVTPEGVPTSFGLPAGRGPNDIAVGPDGALWFTEYISGSIGRITTCGEYRSFPLPNPTAVPYGIVLGADGALWFTEYNADKIGRLLPDPPAQDCPKPPAGDTTKPALGALAFSRSSFRAAPSGASTSARRKPVGTNVSFSLSEAGDVVFTVDRKAPGRSVGGTCVKPKPANAGRKRCQRWVGVNGSFRVAGTAGGNSFLFRGLLNGKPLGPAVYRLDARATDPAGNTSGSQAKNFTIVR